MSRAADLLQKHDLRQTPARREVLAYMSRSDAAVSERDLEQALEGVCDRVTIYRTLHAFLDKGLIHRVPDDSGSTKYALCQPGCGEASRHSHDHVHFKCLHCGRTECVEDVRVPAVHLPQGYQLQETAMLLSGYCPLCQPAHT